MKNYFLGFFLDERSNHKVRKVVGEVGRVFDGQEIKVRWVKPENFHVNVAYLGSNLNFIQKFLLENRLKKIRIPRFNISFEKCELGISRQYKELVYLTLKEGGEELRDLVFNLKNELKVQDSSIYIPHLSLGRVNKDLTVEEQRNISADLKNINQSLNLETISFESNNFCFVESDTNSYKVLRKLETI